MTFHLETLVRRSAVVLVAGLATAAASVAVAGPASADVPQGWSDPKDVNVLHALLLLGGIPLLLFIAITVLVYVPSLIRGERIAPGAAPVENQWLGGPRKTTAELAGPDSDSSQAGGSSARW